MPYEVREENHWSKKVVEQILSIFPDKKVYTCAAGISPSGIVHFGNFRDVMTSFVVAHELKKKGKKSQVLFSWDDFDRYRKVPKGVDPSFEKYIGFPLSKIPSPTGKGESYAENFEKDFERSMKELKIKLVYRYQSKKYESGSYDEKMLYALKHRKEIAEILFSFKTEKSLESKGMTKEEFIEKYYPISIYSRFTGKDITKVLSYDDKQRITYQCLESGKTETIDITKVRIAKLPWKVDWAMRWAYEDVVFEPGGHDHASPGGSYEVSSVLSRNIFKREPPVFTEYKFVGVQGLPGKMSGSKGGAISPGELLSIYEPTLLKWLYARKSPHQTFSLAFDSEIYRQYDEFDREVIKWKENKLSSFEGSVFELIFGKKAGKVKSNVIPFRQAVGFGQIVQWNKIKLLKLLEDMNVSYDKASIQGRLEKARAWLEKYNPNEIIELLSEINRTYAESMDEEARGYVKTLHEELLKKISSVNALNTLIYDIPKDASLTEKENSVRQRAFFKDVYQLLIGKDTGPRLSTFLWAVDRKQVLKLLDI